MNIKSKNKLLIKLSYCYNNLVNYLYKYKLLFIYDVYLSIDVCIYIYSY